jgi:phosphotransferase system HPr (HPr) family protein
MHLRPAMRFAAIAQKFRCTVAVRKDQDEEWIDGKSVMQMAGIAALPGTVLRLQAEGEDAEACLEALAECVRVEFHKLDEA